MGMSICRCTLTHQQEYMATTKSAAPPDATRSISTSAQAGHGSLQRAARKR